MTRRKLRGTWAWTRDRPSVTGCSGGALTPEQLAAVWEVLAAWEDAGPCPAYHRQAQADLARTWPTMARALERLAAATDNLPGSRE